MALPHTLNGALRMIRSPQLRNAAVYLGFSVLTSAIGFAAVMITTRLMPPSEYGLVGVFFSILFFVAPVVSLSAESLIAVNKSELDPARYREFQQTYLALAYASFLVLQTLFVLAWAMGVFKSALLIGAPLFGLVRFLAGMAATEYVVEQRAVMLGVMTAATSLVALGLTVLMIELFSPWGGYRVIAMFTADLMMLGVRYWRRFDLLTQPRWQRATAAQLLRFGLPSLIAVAGGWALNESDKIVVAREAGMHAAGVYAAAAALAAIMTTFNQSLTNALYPEMFRRLANCEGRVRPILVRYAAGFVVFACIFCAAVLVVYYFVADLLLPARYLGGSDVFVGLLLAGIAVCFYRPFGLVAEFLKLGRLRAAAIVLGGLVTIVVADVGVRQGSLLWAPAGVALGYCCAAAMLAVGLWWLEKQK